MNGRFVDITGMAFGRLTAIEVSHTGSDGQARWRCKCNCGNEIVVRGAALRKGNTNSCGCYKLDRIRESNYKDLSGQRFGKLIVVRDVGRKYGKVLYECQCDCGNTITGTAGDIRQGKYVSCGCSKNWFGNKNPRWRGGSSKVSYPSIWNKRLRKLIRDRDKHCCQFPNCEYSDLIEHRKLNVHHINGNKGNCGDTNLISLCASHHMFVETHNPRKFEPYFYSITNG